MKPTKDDDKQYIKMTTTPVNKLIMSLAVPTIISMLISSLYNIADTFFVAKLGTSAAGAVGIVFSLMAIIQAIGFTIGMGSGSNISRLLGNHDNSSANVFASTAFFTSIACGIIIMVLGLVFIDPLMYLLGATDTILPYAKDYVHYIFIGCPIMCASFVLNILLRAQGKAMLGMIGIGLGGILNIVLDPIFIFSFNLGIKGAAFATLISQCISFSVLLFFFLSGKSIVSLNIKYLSRNFKTYIIIFKTGLPSLCRQGLASVSTIALNVNAAVYGDAAVAAMSIVGRIFMFILSIMIGFGQGFQPVVGFNYGAKKYTRVKEAFWFCIKVGTLFLTTIAIIGFIFAADAIALFRKEDLAVITIGAFAFKAQCLALPLQPLMAISNMTLQCTGRSLQGALLASCRQGIFFLPLIIILPSSIGLLGVQIVQPIADVLSFACCFPFIIRFFKDISNENKA